jgi:hypothetical protein
MAHRMTQRLCSSCKEDDFKQQNDGHCDGLTPGNAAVREADIRVIV